jgi:tetratricopeptide (TPR) repeat protein
MGLRGARITEYPKFHLMPEDILIVPENNYYKFPASPYKIVNLSETIEIFSPCRWLTTMNRYCGAGFYADIWGPLPFAIEAALPERDHILKIETTRPIDDSPNILENNKEEYDKGIANYTQALFINVYDSDTFNNRGNIFTKKGEYDKAISDYTQALAIYPYYAEIYYNRGNAYFLKGEHHKAISDYTQALRMDSRDIKTYLKRGNAYIINKEYDKAISDFGQVVRMNANDVKAYHNRAVAYLGNGEYGKAWEDVRKVRGLGFDMNPPFLEQLRKSSGRQQ